MCYGVPRTSLSSFPGTERTPEPCEPSSSAPRTSALQTPQRLSTAECSRKVLVELRREPGPQQLREKLGRNSFSQRRALCAAQEALKL